MSEGPVIDRDSLMERIDNDIELLVELIAIYEEDSASTLAAISEAVAAGDADKLEKTAHSLKGSSYNMSAARVAAQALELEKLGRSGTTAGAESLLKPLQEAFATAVAELKKITKA